MTESSTPLQRAFQVAEAVIIEVLTCGECERDDDHAAIAAMIAEPIARAVAAEREARCRAICVMCSWVVDASQAGAIRRVEAAHKAHGDWWHRFWYDDGAEQLSECDAAEILARGTPAA